jgi:hypothetical protein
MLNLEPLDISENKKAVKRSLGHLKELHKQIAHAFLAKVARLNISKDDSTE